MKRKPIEKWTQKDWDKAIKRDSFIETSTAYQNFLNKK